MSGVNVNRASAFVASNDAIGCRGSAGNQDQGKRQVLTHRKCQATGIEHTDLSGDADPAPVA